MAKIRNKVFRKYYRAGLENPIGQQFVYITSYRWWNSNSDGEIQTENGLKRKWESVKMNENWPRKHDKSFPEKAISLDLWRRIPSAWWVWKWCERNLDHEIDGKKSHITIEAKLSGQLLMQGNNHRDFLLAVRFPIYRTLAAQNNNIPFEYTLQKMLQKYVLCANFGLTYDPRQSEWWVF